MKWEQSLMCSVSSTLGEAQGKSLGGALTLDKEGCQEEEGVRVEG